MERVESDILRVVNEVIRVRPGLKVEENIQRLRIIQLLFEFCSYTMFHGIDCRLYINRSKQIVIFFKNLYDSNQQARTIT